MSRALLCMITAGLALAACFFGDIDFLGRPCDAELKCPDGLVCEPTNRTCVPSSTADDLGDDQAAPGGDLGDLGGDLAQLAVCTDPADAGVSYVIRRLPGGTPINLSSPLCTEPFWSTVAPVVFTGPNATNNTQTCRLVWQPGPPDVVFGCCQVTDTDLRGTRTTRDDDVYSDDGIEYLLTGNLARAFDDTTSKIQINLLGTYADRNYPGGVQDTLYDGHVISIAKTTGTLNDTAADTGYSIKWRADVGFAVAPPHLGMCDFMISDVDFAASDMGPGAEVRTTWASYGTVVNHPSDWGTCMLSCATP